MWPFVDDDNSAGCALFDLPDACPIVYHLPFISVKNCTVINTTHPSPIDLLTTDLTFIGNSSQRYFAPLARYLHKICTYQWHLSYILAAMNSMGQVKNKKHRQLDYLRLKLSQLCEIIVTWWRHMWRLHQYMCFNDAMYFYDTGIFLDLFRFLLTVCLA